MVHVNTPDGFPYPKSDLSKRPYKFAPFWRSLSQAPLLAEKSKLLYTPRSYGNPRIRASSHLFGIAHMRLMARMAFLAFYCGRVFILLGIASYAGIGVKLYECCKSANLQRFVVENLDTCYCEAINIRPPTFMIPISVVLSSARRVSAICLSELHQTPGFPLQPNISETVKALVLLGTIWPEDRIPCLYRGLGTNLIELLPAVGINPASYETLPFEFQLGRIGSG